MRTGRARGRPPRRRTRRGARTCGHAGLVADLGDYHPAPALGCGEPDRCRHRRLADPALAGDEDELAVEQRMHARQSASIRAGPAVPTIGAMSTPLSDIGDQVAFDGDGLVPCVVQDWNTGEVLMLAYMNEQALTRTRESGELHLWSRSRGEPWHKGATSGNVQSVRALRAGLRRRHGARARRSRRARHATRASAHAFTAASCSREPRSRDSPSSSAPSASGRESGPRARTRSSFSMTPQGPARRSWRRPRR